MNLQNLLTDAGVAIAIIGLIGLLAKALIDFHASRPSAEKISVETFADLRQQIDSMEDKIIKLRERVEALEGQLDMKDATIKKLETRLNKLLIYVSGLLKELNDKGIQYTPPEQGLLDTNPRIPPVKKT